MLGSPHRYSNVAYGSDHSQLTRPSLHGLRRCLSDFDLLHEGFSSTLSTVQIDMEIQQMESDIQRLQLRRLLASRLRNKHPPIARLPVEILCEIFIWGLVASEKERPETEPTAFPLLLGRVCHRWRSIAWALPELWSFFHCRVSRYRCTSQAALLNDWLDRSEPRLLSLQISLDDEDAWTGSRPVSTSILDVLIPHCRRWRHLNLTLPEYWYENLFQVQGKLPNLVELSISPPRLIFVPKVLSAFSDAARICNMRCINYYLRDLQFPWERLTTVTLGGASADEALELIRRCPNLVSCQFENMHAIEENYPVDFARNSQLRVLDVSTGERAVHDALLIFLDLPSLEKLSCALPEDHFTPIPAIEGLIQRSECPLRSVHINGPFIEEEDIIFFLKKYKPVIDFRQTVAI